MLKRKLRIAYFDLFHAKFYEDYSIKPKKWGGGPIFARWAKEYWNNEDKEFWIFAQEPCFKNFLSNENKKFCVSMDLNVCAALREGFNVKAFIPNIDYYDIILHGNTGLAMNTMNCRPIQVHWAGFGKATDCHHSITYTLLYGKNLLPAYPGQKTFPVKIGKPVVKIFQEYKKEDCIFQCTRHDPSSCSIEIAKQCIEYKIKCYFAGPIFTQTGGKEQYSLMNYIDNINTFYLGNITEEQKDEMYKKARLSTLIFDTHIAFNQSAIEALSFGTPILCREHSFFKDNFIDNKHCLFYNDKNFIECWEKSKNINQKDCWEKAKEFSVEEMLRTFDEGLQFVIKDSGLKVSW